MFKYTIVVEVSPDMSFKSMEELVEAIKLWRGVRNVELQNASQQTLALDLALPPAKQVESTAKVINPAKARGKHQPRQ